MSYYENRIKELEARVADLSRTLRFKAIPVERQLIDQAVELKAENARLKAEVEQLKKLVGLQESIDTAIDAWIESKKNAAKDGKPTE